jgi:uncharacterized protein (TIGR03067 family)
MFWNRTAIACGIVVFAASGAVAQTAGGDLANLQGTWWTKTQAASLVKSKTRSKPVYTITVLTIEGNNVKMTLTTPDGKTQKFESKFVLDESASPKQFDDAKESVLGKTLAIYELDGDTLKMCSGGPGQPRPKQFAGSSNGLPRLVTYTRGLPPEGMPGRRERPQSRFPAQFKARATVLEVDRHHNVLLRFEDGRELQVESEIGSAYDASGAKIKDAHSVKKVGNVLDVFLTGKMVQGVESYTFIEARLVKGDLVTKAAPKAVTKAAPEPLALQSGVVTALTVWRATIDVDGAPVHVGRHHPAAKAYGVNGELMAKGSAERMLKVGNKVKVFVNKKSNRQAYPTLREIHLIEGSLGDPPAK